MREGNMSTEPLRIYRNTLRYDGLPEIAGPQVSRAIQREFDLREHHLDAHCWWSGRSLFLTTWNDFDETGEALRLEFSNAIAAYVARLLSDDIVRIETLSIA